MVSRLNLSSPLRLFLSKVNQANKLTAKPHSNILCSHCCSTHANEAPQKLRQNPLGIQMLSKSLHKQIFTENEENQTRKQNTEKAVLKSKKHLEKHGLGDKKSSPLPDVDFKLPKLLGKNIDEHFQALAEKYSARYLDLAEHLADANLPPMPSSWVYKRGWTKYVAGKEPVSVGYPEEQGIVFDIEICMKEGPFPTMATAVSSTAWYSWCSDRLIEDQFSVIDQPRVTLPDLIPLEPPWHRGKPKGDEQLYAEKVVVGHNVSFDRSYVKEQYYLQGTKTRFIDTMSLHMATSGLTTLQRKLWNASEKGKGLGDKTVVEFHQRRRGNENRDDDWVKQSSLNNLADVYALYNDTGDKLDKESRNIFVTGTMTDVRDQFQELMTYCAKDVKATHIVFKKILPIYFERFPHPVTFAAMLEMGQAYLPVNHNWDRYVNEAEDTYNNLRREMKMYLMRIAKDACTYLEDERYKKDLWLWHFDWEVKEYKLNKEKKLTIKAQKKIQQAIEEREARGEEETAEERVEKVLATGERVPKRWQHLPSYPEWYKGICPRWNHADWSPGPFKISSQTRVTPNLLRLTWDGYPLHHDKVEKWGYLVPKSLDAVVPKENVEEDEEEVASELEEEDQDDADEEEQSKESKKAVFPISVLQAFIKERQKDKATGKSAINKKMKSNKPMARGGMKAREIGVEGCYFYRLPHKDSAENRVGNPLSQDFLNKMEDGTLKSEGGEEAQRILQINTLISFWRNAKKRIMGQLVGALEKSDFPRAVTSHPNYDEDSYYGAIVPRVIVAGTITRRGVEPTWLTASNAQPNRVGSELKAMVQTPPGYHFVGADVDSQELWIAALLGDAYFAGLHGCTSFGWMNLAGKKSDGTDLHSVVAAKADISRHHAKIINYARIYGAGERFASRLLKQFNYQMPMEEAKQKAQTMMASTKGIRALRLSKQAQEQLEATEGNMQNKNDKSSGPKRRWVSVEYLKKIKRHISVDEALTDAQQWTGGTESSMFNALEKIANSDMPRTPVLDGCISRALVPQSVGDDFLNSRINWVVQSSAVDYLHLMLVCMRWLFEEFKIDGRFCISIHDEVRYLVKSEDRYRAALALQITNLLTRSMFAYKVNMVDLPQSVAFFSAVDIDTVLRKEVTMDCQTPSNPHGLERGYGIPQGEALDIQQILEKTNSSLRKSAQPKPKKTDKTESTDKTGSKDETKDKEEEKGDVKAQAVL